MRCAYPGAVTNQLPPSDHISNAALAIQSDTVALCCAIHQDPELGLHLPRTQERVLESLTGLGLDIKTGISTTTVVAELDTGKPGPTILLRGDMDALPMNEDLESDYRSANEGAMHACGHDAHVAMLSGAARLLAEHRSEFTGKVRFMFQPGEEGFHGARYMIEEGVTEGVDRAFAIHIFPTAPSGMVISRGGPLMASSDTFQLTVHGQGGHASMPHFTHDPIPAAAAIIGGLNTMVTRDIDANQPGVLTVGNIEAGTTTNVIPEHAFIEGTIRTLSEETRKTLHAGVDRVATNIAGAHKCSCTVEIEPGYPVTVNNAAEVQHLAQVAAHTLGDAQYASMPTAVMGAEDWSYVLEAVPGCMAFLGACPPDVDDPARLHPITRTTCASTRMRWSTGLRSTPLWRWHADQGATQTRCHWVRFSLAEQATRANAREYPATHARRAGRVGCGLERDVDQQPLGRCSRSSAGPAQRIEFGKWLCGELGIGGRTQHGFGSGIARLEQGLNAHASQRRRPTGVVEYFGLRLDRNVRVDQRSAANTTPNECNHVARDPPVEQSGGATQAPPIAPLQLHRCGGSGRGFGEIARPEFFASLEHGNIEPGPSKATRCRPTAVAGPNDHNVVGGAQLTERSRQPSHHTQYSTRRLHSGVPREPLTWDNRAS